jgi:hypothetical protein
MFVKKDLNMKKWILPVFAIGMIFMAACSDDSKDTAGTSEESEGLYAVENLDVAGLAQKGPFVKGSAVTVQGIDCKTMKLHRRGSSREKSRATRATLALTV